MHSRSNAKCAWPLRKDDTLQPMLSAQNSATVALMALGWLWWRAWAGVDGMDAAAFCVAGVALSRHPSYFHVAGVAFRDIHKYIHIYTCIHPSIHACMHTYVHTYIHAYIHTSNTTCPYTTYSHLVFHAQLTPHQSFTIFFLFPAFPIPSLPFFCCLLEEVDMWGY